MDARFILEGFTRDYESEIRKFELKVEQYEEFLEKETFFPYACRIARETKANILTYHYETLRRATDLGLLSNRLFRNINKALKDSFDIIDTDMSHANDYWEFVHFTFKKNAESLSGTKSVDVIEFKKSRMM